MSNRSGLQTVTATIPVDLILVGLLGVWMVANAVGLVGAFAGTVVLGFVAVLFAPGYAAVATLFPAASSRKTLSRRREGQSHPAKTSPPPSALDDDGRQRTLDGTGTVTGIERLVLSIALSVCIVPLLGLGLNFTQWGVDTTILMGTVGTITVVFVGVAAIRRGRLPPQERFGHQFPSAAVGMVGRLRTGERGSLLSVLLIVGFLVAGGGLGFAVLDAEPGEQFTELYLTTEDGDTGEHVADGYPIEMTGNDTASVSVGIGNHEGETMEYTVVVLLQSLDETGDVREVRQLDTFTAIVEHGDTWREPHTIRPELRGEGLRVSYLLYTEPPSEDTSLSADTAYRNVHIWIDVTEPESD